LDWVILGQNSNKIDRKEKKSVGKITDGR
jgi:hypothetical protein